MSFDASSRRLAEGFASGVRECESLGIDLRGYDILHLVDDIDAIRRAYGYETIALRGSSFGSQWALAYLQRYPDRVERMILSSVEPLDHGYDSAEGVWNVFRRIEEQARASKDIELPEVGLLGAVEAVVSRLEKEPLRVRGRHPTRGYEADIVVGPDDFRHYLLRPILDAPVHSRRTLELWPKFVLEVYREDYQYLASKIIDDRPEYERHGLLLTLVDNSLGISGERQSKLDSEPARRWLGDINWLYAATRGASPTPVISDEFRKPEIRQTPVLLVHGTLDLATPIENAHELLRSFPRSHMITVKGGTHAATHHAASVDVEFLEYLTAFLNADDPAAAFEKLPGEISLPPLHLDAGDGPSLSLQLIRQGTPRAE